MFLLFSALKKLFIKTYSLTQCSNFGAVTAILHLTRKRVECKPFAVSDHLLLQNNDTDFNDFTILCRDYNGFRLSVKESSISTDFLLLIRKLHLCHYYYLIELSYHQWNLVNFFITYFDIIYNPNFVDTHLYEFCYHGQRIYGKLTMIRQ